MGIRLVVAALDCPEDLTPAERLLLVALAEKADDTTRRVLWARGEDPRATLRRRTGQSESGLRKCFGRLAARGLDPRVPLGTDRRGRQVFSYEGTAVEFCLPLLPSGDPTGSALVDNPTERRDERVTTTAPVVTLSSHGGDPLGSPPERERWDQGVTHVPLSLEDPSDARESLPAGVASQLPLVPLEQRGAVLELVARLGNQITEADAIGCVAWVANQRGIGNIAGYVSRFPAADVRAKAELHRARATQTPALDASKCDHRVVNGREIIGAGANASRRCGGCEQDDPAEDEMRRRAS